MFRLQSGVNEVHGSESRDPGGATLLGLAVKWKT